MEDDVQFTSGDEIPAQQLGAAVKQGLEIRVVMVQDDGATVAFNLTTAFVDAQGNFGGQGAPYYEMTSYASLIGSGKQFARAVNASGVFVDIPKGQIRTASSIRFIAR
jgi:hypothetical protein